MMVGGVEVEVEDRNLAKVRVGGWRWWLVEVSRLVTALKPNGV